MQGISSVLKDSILSSPAGLKAPEALILLGFRGFLFCPKTEVQHEVQHFRQRLTALLISFRL
jgi:hypothetical protein